VNPNDIGLIPVDITKELNLPVEAKHGKNPYKFPNQSCVISNIARSFTKPVALQIHWFQAHQGYRILCSWPGCKKIYRDVGGQQRHIQIAHQGRRYPYPVAGCEQVVYRSLAGLRIHKAVSHVGQWVYCNEEGCEDLYGFCREQDLNLHVQRYHNRLSQLLETNCTNPPETTSTVLKAPRFDQLRPIELGALSNDTDPDPTFDRYDELMTNDPDEIFRKLGHFSGTSRGHGG
jgi:hypothetical protein